MELVKTPHADGKKRLLENVDALRKQIEDGEAVAFAAVSIGKDDAVWTYVGTGAHTSNLRMFGAVAHLQLKVHLE